MKRLKRGVIWVFVLFFIALFAYTVNAVSGCFTEPGYVDFYDECRFISEAAAQNECGATVDPAACINDYFLVGVVCDNVDACASSPNTWCGDTCTQVNYQAECLDRTAWINDTATPEQCKPGCCVCTSTTPGAANLCEVVNTQADCEAKCATPAPALGYFVGLFNTSLTDIDICKADTTFCDSIIGELGKVIGTVLDVSKMPIEGVRITIFGKVSFTDASGFYSIGDLPAGTLTVTAEKSGFETATELITLASGEEKVVNFTLTAGGTGVISGTVTDSATGDPIDGVLVTIGLCSDQGSRQEDEGESRCDEDRRSLQPIGCGAPERGWLRERHSDLHRVVT